MKRFDCCLCVLHGTRIFVIAMVVVCSGIAIKSPAQSLRQSEETECLGLTSQENTCPIYDGRVNLELPRFNPRQQSPPPSTEEPEEALPDSTLDNGQEIQLQQAGKTAGFNWTGAILQSTLFLAICHGFRLATEPGTRAELKGPFFRDYWASVKSLRGWADGDEFLVNYIGHPMGGSVVGYIEIQNDPKGSREEVELNNRKYWKSRLRAMAWAAAYSTQFEIGPISEASLGNVGEKQTEKSRHPMAWVDLVVTPTMGTAWLVGEDLLDRYLIRWIESKINDRKLIIITRTFLNPTRSFANMHRGDWFWKRENRP
ncbi:MAG: hypothetical protein J2P41_17135 [Blastocatellia bacterium]|nr:hypothetical protein [Blastocatellia bacterium]